ncbi:YpmS family protein [Streptococcus equinus]|uniref:YpmS family protein n=1 Tax=Streptococcus equinus TaxID=1335 RepID=UPI00088890B2|nr:DUF2140 family protein [Streptococcus equinus]SDI55132.1 Uncharacterized protein YpmS [Streptococcus equinus]SEP67937.1 Uncharacterized protein YpmS [Streptococcus equinus]
MKLNKNGTKTNWWKWGFLLILAINVAFVGVIASRLIQVREPAAQSINSKKSDNVKVGTISTTREQLNDTVASYLKEYQTKKTSYSVYATSSAIMFEGTYTFLGYEVPLYIYFQPSRLESGAIQLKITSFSVGTLTLPESEVLKYLKSSINLPDFVEVLPKESVININIQDIKNDADIFLKATTIDLVGDQFNFDIYKKNS